MVYRLDVSPGDSINVNYNNHDADGSIYIVTACDSVSRRCVRGADDRCIGRLRKPALYLPDPCHLLPDPDATDPGTYGAWDCTARWSATTSASAPTRRRRCSSCARCSLNRRSRVAPRWSTSCRVAHAPRCVVDPQGRTVRTLVDPRSRARQRSRGSGDGTDDQGHRVGAGIYFAQLNHAGQSSIRRMVFVN